MEKIINSIISFFLRLITKVDTEELKKIPLEGPCILIANHTSILEVPLLYLRLRPRRTIGLGKAELFNSPVGFLMRLWKAIPVKRGGIDRESMKACFKTLEEGNMLCLAPEGTRNKTGVLKKAKSGIVLFAREAGVPVYPIAHIGTENLAKNMKRLRRTKITVKVGEPFQIETGENELNSTLRREVADEVMVQVARLMPEELRGYYKDKIHSECRYVTPVK